MNIWWKLRRYWHLPSTMHMAAKEPLSFAPPRWHEGDTVREYLHYWHYRARMEYQHAPFRALGRDLRNIVSRVWWSLMWLQPFRCNSERGGWRTRFCEYLEDRARAKDGYAHS